MEKCWPVVALITETEPAVVPTYCTVHVILSPGLTGKFWIPLFANVMVVVPPDVLTTLGVAVPPVVVTL